MENCTHNLAFQVSESEMTRLEIPRQPMEIELLKEILVKLDEIKSKLK